MKTMAMVCISCPKGCDMQVTEENNQLTVLGNSCPKGLAFAKDEWYHPIRTLCTTVKTNSKKMPRIPVKTSQGIPKDELFHVMRALDDLCVTLPIHQGDLLVKNILETGADVVATLSMEESKNG